MATTRFQSIHYHRHQLMVSLLTRARLDAGVSQSELALGVGMRQPDISKIENNERRVDLIEFLDIVLFLAKKSNNPELTREMVERLIEDQQ